MRTTILFLILTSALPALADRYWDVPKPDAELIAAKVRNQIVIEYCAGCGNIVTVLKVKSGVVKKGDYSDNKQVHVEREVVLSGTSPLPLHLTGACGAIADHVDVSERRLDIPYSYVLEGDTAHWVGLGTSVEKQLNTKPLKISAATREAIARCAKLPPPPKVTLKNQSIDVPREKKGVEMRVKVAGVLAKIGNKSIAFPSFVAANPKLASTFTAHFGTAFVVELRPDGAPFGHVVLTPDPHGEYLAHVVAAPLERDKQPGFRYDPIFDRVRSTKGMFVLVDDLNIREKPKGKVLTRVHRGAHLTVLGEKQDWLKVRVEDEDITGWTARSLLTDVAPLFDTETKTWRAITHAEGAIIGLEHKVLDRMRALADVRLKNANDICKHITALRAVSEPVGIQTGDAWMSDRGGNFDHLQEVFARLKRTLPGLDVRPMAEGVPVSVMYAALSKGQNKDIKNVLRAAEALEGAPFPIWMEQTWDLGGCVEAGRANLSLKLLSTSWMRAPKCLQGLLKQPLTDSITSLGRSTCFCKGKKKVARDLKKIAPHLKTLGALGGDKAAAAHASMKSATYNSDCAN